MTAHEWTAADYAADATAVRADYADMVADQLNAAAWDAADETDQPTARDIAADEEWAERYWRARERHEEFWA